MNGQIGPHSPNWYFNEGLAAFSFHNAGMAHISKPKLESKDNSAFANPWVSLVTIITIIFFNLIE